MPYVGNTIAECPHCHHKWEKAMNEIMNGELGRCPDCDIILEKIIFTGTLRLNKAHYGRCYDLEGQNK